MNIKYGMTAIVGAYFISTLGVSPVMAATITGSIKVNISKGDFAGVYTGDFAYDDTHLTKVGSESMNISGGNGDLPGLLSVNFRFLDFASGLTPVTYTAKDDVNFPNSPVLLFENGVPTELGFIVAPGNDGGVLGGNNGFMFGDPKAFFFSFRNGTNGGDGIVTLEITESTSIPEKSSPFASLLAFLGLGGVHLGRKSRKGNN